MRKPDCVLIGENGNIFNLMGIASRTLRQHGLEDQADEMRERIMGGERATCCEALDVIGEYVNITGPDDQKEAIQMGGITFGQ